MPDDNQPQVGFAATTVRTVAMSHADAQLFDRVDFLALAVTAGIAMVVYLSTMAPDVTLENAGGLAPAAMYAGVPYNPGFPAWTIYSWAFTKIIPFSTIAWRIAVGSALAAALTAGLVAMIVSRGANMLFNASGTKGTDYVPLRAIALRLVVGASAGMALAVSTPTWTKALIVDIWTFGDLLFTITLVLLLRWLSRPAQRRYLYVALWMYGLSMTGNEEFVVLAPALFLIISVRDPRLGRDFYLLTTIWFLIVLLMLRLSPDRETLPAAFVAPFYCFSYYNWPLFFTFLASGLPAAITFVRSHGAGSEWRAVLVCAVCVLAGLAFSFYLPVASMADPPMNWAYPRTVEGFFHALTRGQYDQLHVTKEFSRFASQLKWQAQETGRGFGWIYLVLAVLPVARIRKASALEKAWTCGILAMFLCAGPVMIATLNFNNDRASMELVQPWLGPAHAVLAMLAGLGMAIVANKIQCGRMPRGRTGESGGITA